MALTDTAEYWWGVKRNYPYVGPNYYHIPGAECGHRHLFEAKRLGDVNCYSCLKLIKEGYDHKLPEGITESKSAKRRRLREEREIAEMEKLYGRCVCGALRTERKNSNTGELFLGCTRYPICKITAKIKLL